MTTIVPESARDFDDLKWSVPYPPLPLKPCLNRKAFKTNKEFHAALAESEDRYEEEKVAVKEARDCYDKKVLEVEEAFWQWAFKKEGIENLPADVLSKVTNYADQEGHSGGYSEIYNVLLNIVDMVKSAYDAGRMAR